MKIRFDKAVRPGLDVTIVIFPHGRFHDQTGPFSYRAPSRYPQSGTSDAKLAWVNTGTGTAAVRLDVAVTDHNDVAAPVGGVSLSADQIQLAAGAGAGATLRVDGAAFVARPGFYTAVVTARVGGAVVSRTPVAFYVEPPSHDLTVGTTSIPGTPDGSWTVLTMEVTNIDDPAVYAEVVYGEAGDTSTLRVPAGRYSVMASFMSWTDDNGDQRAALAGDPDLEITRDTSMRLDLSQAKQLTASVDGVATEASSVGLSYVQMPRRGVGWTDFAFAWGDQAKEWKVFVAPNSGTGIGTFQAYAAFGLDSPGNGPSPYLYDLIHPFGNGIPTDPTYRITAAEQATLARIDQHFNTLDRPDSVTGHKRYGFSPEGVSIAETTTDQVSGDRTDYVSPGFTWSDEAFWDGIVTQEAKKQYAPGSRQEKTWIQQPLRSDWYDDPGGSLSTCQPFAPSRTRGHLHVELVTLTDQHGRFDCLADGWDLDMKRTLTLTRNGKIVGQTDGSIADYDIPRQGADYRLTYDVDTSADLPISTRVTTSWTFRSTGPKDNSSIPLPLLSLDYALPLDTANHPTASCVATFTVRQAHGVPAQAITSFTVSTSLDGGATWKPANVNRGDGTYQAQLPQPAAGQTVSLRVAAQGKAGSGVEQTIIDAYRAG